LRSKERRDRITSASFLPSAAQLALTARQAQRFSSKAREQPIKS